MRLSGKCKAGYRLFGGGRFPSGSISHVKLKSPGITEIPGEIAGQAFRLPYTSSFRIDCFLAFRF